MNKNAVWVFAVVLALGWNLVLAPAHAEPAGMPEPAEGAQGPEDDGPPALESLQLTAEQIQKLKDHRSAQRKDMIKLRAELEAKQVDLAAEIGKDQPDRKAIEKTARQMGEVHARMIIARTEAILFLRSILTSEQKQRMDENFLNPEKSPGLTHRRGKHRGK